MVNVLDEKTSIDSIKAILIESNHLKFCGVINRVEFECSSYSNRAPDILIACDHQFEVIQSPFICAVKVSGQASARIDAFNHLEYACTHKLPVLIDIELCVYSDAQQANITIIRNLSAASLLSELGLS